ncbi:MAG: hypothetical protein R3E61_01375 [Pseudomonadales bacterium]
MSTKASSTTIQHVDQSGTKNTDADCDWRHRRYRIETRRASPMVASPNTKADHIIEMAQKLRSTAKNTALTTNRLNLFLSPPMCLISPATKTG